MKSGANKNRPPRPRYPYPKPTPATTPNGATQFAREFGAILQVMAAHAHRNAGDLHKRAGEHYEAAAGLFNTAANNLQAMDPKELARTLTKLRRGKPDSMILDGILKSVVLG